MHHSIKINPVPDRTPHARLDLDQPMGTNNKLLLLAQLDLNLPRRNRDKPRQARVFLKSQHAAGRDGVDAEGDVVGDGDGLGCGEVGFGEGDCW
jgi:hypothetical protein